MIQCRRRKIINTENVQNETFSNEKNKNRLNYFENISSNKMTESTTTTTDRSLFAFWSHLESILRPPVRPPTSQPIANVPTTPLGSNSSSSNQNGHITTSDTSVDQVLPNTNISEKPVQIEVSLTNLNLNSSDEIFKCLNVCINIY